VADWYDPDYYDYSPDRNPQGPDSGFYRITRGGSWRHKASFAASAHRNALIGAATDFIGFRCVLSVTD
jgi:formylglycine-generating enzyme required for sulfatase activity